MTRIANISLGATRAGATELTVSLGGQRFSVTRHATGRDFAQVRRLLRQLDGEVDVIAVSGMFPTVTVGDETFSHPEVDELLALPTSTPVVTGQDLRTLYQRWCLRHLVRTEPELLSGRSVGMYMGLLDLELVPILEEAARVLRFGDPFLHLRVPTVLTSRTQLESYARVVAPLLARRSMASLSANHGRLYARLRERWAEKMATVDVIVSPWAHLQTFGGPELDGKIVITDRCADHVVTFLRARGVVHVAATYPSLALQHNLDWSVMEAMLWVTDGDLGASSQEAALRLLDRLADGPEVQRFGELPARRRRFAFVTQPRDQKDLWRHPVLKPVARLPLPARNAIEWLVAQTAPRRYGEIHGVVGVVGVDDAAGAEVDGLVIALPSTPHTQSRISARNASRQLRRAVKRAEEWGAEIVALGPTARPMLEAAAAVARTARIPVTTGHAYQASTTFAAARSAVLRMGFVERGDDDDDGGMLQARCLVLGASGAFGTVAAHLCAGEYRDVVLAGPRPDRLLELKTAIEESGAAASITCTTAADVEIGRADLIIVCTGRAAHAEDLLDLRKVKAGCVVCDVAQPPAIPAAAALSRPDVLVIDGGVIELPGRARMDCDLGLPGRAVYATLAEAALLALEGRFESFSSASTTPLDRVREMDVIGRRHGARLAALRGPGGVVTDEDIELCRAAALKDRHLKEPSSVA